MWNGTVVGGTFATDLGVLYRQAGVGGKGLEGKAGCVIGRV